MTFLQPFILLGLPLVLLPVIIHFLNRLRHRPQPWGAMQFLLAASRSSVNQAKLKQFLILLLRTLAVLALVLFLARPLTGGYLGWAVSTAPDVIFLLVDRSASMEHRSRSGAGSKREEVLRTMAENAAGFTETSHLILIDSATRNPQRLNNAASLSDHPLTTPTDAAADIPAMLQSALSWLVENQAGNAEIWIGSDLQPSNWKSEDPRWAALVEKFQALPQTVRIRLLAMDEAESQNDTTLALQDQSRRLQGDQREMIFSLDIDRTSTQAQSIPIEFSLDGVSSELELESQDAKQRWRHRVDLGDQLVSGWGSFAVPTDANPRNNSVYFVYGEPGNLGATVVATDAIAGPILQICAADFQNDPPRVAGLRSGWSASSDAWEDHTLLIWQEPLPNEDDAAELTRFAEEGGIVLFLPPAESGDQTFQGLSWGEREEAQQQTPFSIGRWDQISGPLADTDEGLSLPLDQLDTYQRYQLTGYESALASFNDGNPLLARKALGQGAVYFLTTLPRPDWSNLSEGTILIPLVQRLLQDGARRQEKITYATSGEIDPLLESEPWKSVTGQDSADYHWTAGVYRAGDKWLAVNRAPAEDEPGRLEGDQAKALFGKMTIAMQDEQAEESEALQGEAWRLFLFAMLAFMIGEAYLILPTAPKPVTPRPAI